MGEGHRFSDPHRQEVRRQAPGVHPLLRRNGGEHAGRHAQSPFRQRGDADHGGRAVPRAQCAGVRRWRQHGAKAPGIPCFITGTVRGLDGRPIANAKLDLWQTDGEGLYEAQRDVTEPWMRGVFHTKPDGSYTIRTVAPIGYSIPMDGPIGDLVKRTDVSEMRPAHIHFCIEAPGYHRVVTHLFQRTCPYLETDVVYGVKAPLIVDFVENPAGVAPNGQQIGTTFYTIRYDFVLQPLAQAAAAA